MQYSQLSKVARHHIKADLLPERVALQTKTHHVIVTFRFLLLFFSISAAVVAVFDDSLFYAVVAPILLIPCLFCWLTRFGDQNRDRRFGIKLYFKQGF